jgi:hypothetical protein
MGLAASKHAKVLWDLEKEAKRHRQAVEQHEEEHASHREEFEATHAVLSQKIAVLQKEWAAQDAGWRNLSEAIKAEEEAIKAKEKLLVSKIVEMLSGKMFSACFREWKALTQSLKRQRYREGYRTQVEEHKFDNSELTVQLREVEQKIAFMDDDGLKSKATALISRLGHRDRAMWFAMWRSFVRESIYNRRDKVQLEWTQKLENMTQERDYMLWRLDKAQQTQNADSNTIKQLGQQDVNRTACLPRLGEGLLLALHRVDETTNKYPSYARRTEVVEQQASLRRACSSFHQGSQLEPEPELEPQPKIDEERAAEVATLSSSGFAEDEAEPGHETTDSSVYGRAMAMTHDFTNGSPDASLTFPKLQVPAALPRTALRRHGYMLPRRVPRQIEPLFSQAADGVGSAMLYGTQGGGAAAGYTEFSKALEDAIRKHTGAEGGAAREVEDIRGASTGGATASDSNWVKPQPPPERHQPLMTAPQGSSAQQQHRHRQLKPVVR